MREFRAGEIVAGRYRLKHPLAKGGMGSVWTAWNQQLDVPVAIKFMTTDAQRSAELVARFELEAKAAAQMRIPQVVHIFEHGLYEGVPYMVMELLEGEDLGQRVRLRGRLPLDETARIVGEVCKALRRAHELGIVHRDLKPANVYLARSGGEEIVKVLDFGIAKLLAGGSPAAATKTGALMGTPNYMSPEQAHRKNRQVDHRSDLWSLGIIAFRAITGKLPFAGGNPVDILLRIVMQPAPSASSLAPDVSPEVDRFFARALASDPDKRFQNARDFADAMNALVPGPAQSPLGQSRSGDPPLRAASPLGQSWSDGVPSPRGSRPGEAAPPPRPPGTLPMNTPALRDGPAATPMERAAAPSGSAELDLLDGAATVPIQRSAIGQAYLAAASPQPGAARAGTPPAGPVQIPGAAAGAAPARASLPQTPAAQLGAAPGTQAPAQPRQAPVAPQDPGQGTTAPLPKVLLRTLPLGTPALASPQPALAAPKSHSGPAAAPITPSADAAAVTSAGDSAGTITSATGELPVRRPRRTSYVVWAAGAAALLVIAVVGSVVAIGPAQPEPEPIPLPPTVAPTLTADPPGHNVTPVLTATPGPTAVPSATSSAIPSAAPSAGSARPRNTTAPKPTSTAISTVSGKRVFNEL